MPSLREHIEAIGRKIRNFLSPAGYRVYRELSQKTYKFGSEDKPVVAFSFRYQEIDKVGGRYFYFLFKEFSCIGMEVAIQLNFSFIASVPHKKYKSLILKEKVLYFKTAQDLPSGSIIITDHDGFNGSRNLRKVIFLKFGELLPQTDSEFSLPFSMHPQNLDTKPMTCQSKHKSSFNRIFFSGEASQPRYNRESLSKKYKVLTRFDALNKIKEAIADHFWNSEDLKKLDLRTERSNIVPAGDWMMELASSDFFIALPGVAMPMCHNAVEALAVGTIPILQYPQYFNPPLIHGVNCLTYNSGDELINVISSAMQMELAERNKMSESCMLYYDKHLKLGSFSAKLIFSQKLQLTILVDSYRTPVPFPCIDE